MSQDLLTQLGEYGEFCEELQSSVSADEVFDEMVIGVEPQLMNVRPIRLRRGWQVAGAAAAVVLTIGLLALLTRQTASDAPVLSQPSPSPTVATPAPSPSSAGWSAIPVSALGAGKMTSVTVGGPGLVAVGSTAAADEGGDAAVWTSVDGITWTRVPHDGEVFGGGSMESVTAGGPGLVAVGSDGSPLGGGDAAVWTSIDGIIWSRVPHDEAVFGGETDGYYGQSMSSVTAGGPGLVAVGSADEVAAVWTSVDGIVWSRVPHDEATFGGSRYDGQGWPSGPRMSHVTEGGPGLVAVGVGFSGGDADGAVWTSVDGLTWTRVPHDEEVFGGSGQQAMSGVTAAGPGLIAVGVERSGYMQGVIWTSADGLTWTRAVGGTLDRGEMRSVTGGDSGLVAVGWFGWTGGGGALAGCRPESRLWCGNAVSNSDAAVWTSVDGIVWTRVPHDEETIGTGLMLDLINTDSGLIAVGSDGTNAAVWVGP